MTIIATWGGSESDSYIGLTEANSFVATSIFNHAAWDELSAQQREAALKEATRDVDSYQYVGERYSVDQMLEFPREVRSDYPWNRTENLPTVFSTEQLRMKLAIERATCFQAVWIAQNNGRNMHAEAIAQGLKSWSQEAGPTSESYEYSGGKIDRLCSQALAIIAPWRTQKRVFRG